MDKKKQCFKLKFLCKKSGHQCKRLGPRSGSRCEHCKVPQVPKRQEKRCRVAEGRPGCLHPEVPKIPKKYIEGLRKVPKVLKSNT